MSENQVEDPEKVGALNQNLVDESDETTQYEGGALLSVLSDTKFDNPSLKKRLQIINFVTWIFCLVFNGIAQKISSATLNEITNDSNTLISPASYAFGIWALIYTLISIFAIYQALPDTWVPKRNNNLIFGQIKYVFAVNMVANGLWLVIFMTNSAVGFAVGLIVIILMLVTQVFIMQKTLINKLNIVEIISLRIGFTIYTGWVTAATILNVAFFLKSVGMKDPNAGITEETWTILVLYVALVIYLLVSFREKNPLYGAIYIWVLFAIRARQSLYSDIGTNSIIIVVLMILGLAVITTLNIKEKMGGNMERGLFY